jgi:hypothetical protein
MTIRGIMLATLFVALLSAGVYYLRLGHENDRQFWRAWDREIVHRHDAWLLEHGYERRPYMVLDGRVLTRWEKTQRPTDAPNAESGNPGRRPLPMLPPCTSRPY